MQDENVTPKFSLLLHLLGIFLIFLFSILGPSIPLLALRFQSLNGIFTPNVIRIGKFFGTGCIFATAFVHLLFPAVTALSHPNLPLFFKETYPPLGGALAMLGTFFMIFLDFAMMKWKHANTSTSMASSSTLPSHATTEESIKPDIHTGCCHDEARLTAWQSPHPHHSDSDMTTKKFGFYVLEIGIALHSVIVGFTLGLTPSTSYLSMMIAVIFHQFFEGFALGALAAPLYLSRFALCTLIFFFSMTTTLGASLGTLLQAVSNMDVNHPVNLILQGVMSSLSSGIMIYSALLDVIVPELKHPSFYSLSTQQQTVSLFSMLVGATIMAVLAKWA